MHRNDIEEWRKYDKETILIPTLIILNITI